MTSIKSVCFNSVTMIIHWLFYGKTCGECRSAVPLPRSHNDDVMMTTIASQISSLTSVYSTVYSDADQRKHQSSASLAFVWGIHRDRWIPHTKSQLRRICFLLMTSSCIPCYGNGLVAEIQTYEALSECYYNEDSFLNEALSKSEIFPN